MRSSRLLGFALCGALAALLGPSQARGQNAQYASGQWRVVPVFGVTVFDDATPFKTSALVGGQVQYSINNLLSVGGIVNLSRPEVDGSYFPRALFVVSADTTVLFETGYQASQVTYAGLITVGTSLGTAYLYAQGGLGGYTTFVDRQSFRDAIEAGSRAAVTHLMIPLGVGFSYSLGSVVGVQLGVSDDIYTNFVRGELNPLVDSRFRNTCEVDDFCILEANSTAPEESSTVHNFRFTLGFEFTPGI